MAIREFKVNDYITLKLEFVKGDIDVIPGWSTVIYVKGKRFKQCKYLLINVRVDDISSFDKIQSMDEAEEEVRDRFLKKYGNDYWVDYNEGNESVEKIPPKWNSGGMVPTCRYGMRIITILVCFTGGWPSRC